MIAACSALDAQYVALDNHDESDELMHEFRAERKVLENEIGFVVGYSLERSWASSQLEVGRSYFPNKVKPAIVAIRYRLPQAPACDRAIVCLQSNLKLRRLRAGLFIDDMVDVKAQNRRRAVDWPLGQ